MSSYQIPEYFTQEQATAVFNEGNNILVSAAAGCGKTTLMVERIIRKIIQDKVNINELIVVTFTEAAAAELKQRLELELTKKLVLNPEDAFLQHQLAIINDSYIMTFHALCFRLLNENNAAFNFDNSLVIGDGMQIANLKQQAFHNLLSNHHLEDEFQILDSFYNNIIDNQGLFNIINQCLDICITKGSIKEFKASNQNKIPSSIFSFDGFNEILCEATSFYLKNISVILKQMQSFDLSSKNVTSIEESILLFEQINNAFLQQNYQVMHELLSSYKIFSKPAKADNHFKHLHDTLKKDNLIKLQELYVLNNDETLAYITQNQKNVSSLLKYTEYYYNYLHDLKKKTGILEFNDLEQYLIELLYDGSSFSKTALTIQRNINEIMIDEYQDTNLIQEKIVNALANSQNTFMVGDLKQSIYRFRNATSKLFSDKYTNYKNDNNLGEVIDLSFNFRSKDEVLETTNYIFKSVFSYNIGGIDYDKNNQLYFKNEKLHEVVGDFKTKYFINTNADRVKKRNNYQASVSMMITEIKKLIDTGIEYKQIAILFKNRSNINILKTGLEEAQIPFMLHTNTGFYSSYEIQDLINFLKFLVNPSDDVSLLGVLRSYFFNFSEQDLLELSLIKEKNYFLKLKNSKFLEAASLIQQIIIISKTKTPLELINDIYNLTNYTSYIEKHNNFEQFLINITTFKNIIQNNIDYYNSLSFIIDELDTNIARNFDESLPAILSSKQNVINLMTIHKSKGLEFDYVFLFDNSLINFSSEAKINNLNKQLVIEYFDPVQKIKAVSPLGNKSFNPLTNLITFSNKKDIISEELRVLYVALTRAKYQLYIFDNLTMEQLELAAFKASLESEWLYSEAITLNFKRMLEPVLYSFLRHRNGLVLRDSTNMIVDDFVYSYYNNLFEVELVNVELNDVKKQRSSVTNKYPKELVIPKDIDVISIESTIPSLHTIEPLDFNKLTSFDSYQQGTNVHLVLETLDFNSKNIIDNLNNLCDNFDISISNREGLLAFIQSDFFNTIINNTYFKEYSFSYLDDNKLVNGIIDLYVETASIIYIIDYKSDNITINELINNYSEQLNTYSNIIKTSSNKTIVKLIYSIKHKQFIEV